MIGGGLVQEELQEQLRRAMEAEQRKEAGAPEAASKLRQQLRTVTEQLTKLRTEGEAHKKVQRLTQQQQEALTVRPLGRPAGQARRKSWC